MDRDFGVRLDIQSWIAAESTLSDEDIRKRVSDAIEAAYNAKVQTYGATPQGVDWNSQVSQELRFEQLLTLVKHPASFSLNDLGCGYGQLFRYVEAGGLKCDYLGLDISEEMIAAARRLFHGRSNGRFISGSEFDRIADYSVASGVLNVKLDETPERWSDYVASVLDRLAAASRAGFAFNCLTKYSDTEHMRPDLFYADPCQLFDYCRTRYSNNVALLHDYGLYEFTVVVRL